VNVVMIKGEPWRP